MRIQCANCQSVVNVADNLRGKAIRCPKCQAPTRVPGRQMTQLAPPQYRQPPMDGYSSAGGGRRRTMMASQYGEPIGQDRYAPPAPAYDDDYYDDNQPRYSRPREQSGSSAATWVVIFLGILLVGGVGVGGIMYVKSLLAPVAKTDPKAKDVDATEAAEEKLTNGLQYLPADSDIVLGVDMTSFSGTTFRNSVLAHFVRVDETKELAGLAQEAESVLFAGNSKSEKWVFVAQLKKDHEQAELDKLLRLKSSIEIDGKTIHQSARGYQVYVPDPRTVVVLQQFKADDIISLLDGKDVEGEMQEQIKSVNSKTAWFVSTSSAVKGQLVSTVKNLTAVDAAKAARVVESGKFVTATLAPEGKSLTLEVNVVCENEEDAALVDNLNLGPALSASTDLRSGLLFAAALMRKDIELKKTVARREEDSVLVGAKIELTLKELPQVVKQTPMDDKEPMKDDQPAFKQGRLQSALIPDTLRPDNIGSDTRNKALSRVVFIRVTDKGVVSEGSGFFGAEPDLVFTNAHVVGSSFARVELFLNKGQENEERITGSEIEVKAIDRASDLAVLRVIGRKNLPAPLPVELEGCSLTEAQPVYICGFPGSAGSAREASVTDSTVATLRADVNGVTQIQVNGGMDSGSSGGPVIDSRGVVVGIARAGIKGSSVNFAVPAEKIRGLLHGRIDDTNVGDAYVDNTTVKVPVSISFLQASAPRTSVKDVKLELWMGAPGQSRPAALKPPEPVAGDGARLLFEQSPRTRQTADFEVELPSLPAGQVYWMQASIVSSNGVQQWAPAVAFVPDAPLVIAPARLTLGNGMPQRTFKLASKFEFSDRSKPKKVETGADFMQVQGLEVLDVPAAGGISDRLLLDVHSDFTCETNGARQPRNADAQTMIRKGTYSYQGFRTGQLTTFVGPDFGNAAYEARREAENICDKLNSTYRVVSLPVPNKEVTRGEVWYSTSKWSLDAGRKETTLQLTCKYQGLRTAEDGKSLAFVRVSGTMKDSADTQIVSGYALFDPSLGFYVKVHLKARPEFDNDLLVQNKFEAVFERVTGNLYGIEPPIVVAKETKKPDENPDMPDLSKYSDADLIGLWVVDTQNCQERAGVKPYMYKGYEEAIKIEGNKVTWVKRSGDFQSNYPPADIASLDSSKKPKQITFYVPAAEKKWVAVYKIEGDKLYVATNLDKDNRPKLFVTPQEIQGSAQYVRVYKRAQPGEYSNKPEPKTASNPTPKPDPNPTNPSNPPPKNGGTTTSPPADADPVLAGLLGDLKSGDVQKAKHAADKLAKMTPTADDMRKDLVLALVPLLKHQDANLHNSAFDAFGVWAGKDGVQTLVNHIANATTANIAMDTLATVDPLKAAQACALKLSDPGHASHASGVLKQLGSVAESAVLPSLKSTNSRVQQEACQVLEKIGTNNSLQALQGLVDAGNNPKFKYLVDRSVSNAAVTALRAIQARNGASVANTVGQQNQQPSTGPGGGMNGPGGAPPGVGPGFGPGGAPGVGPGKGPGGAPGVGPGGAPGFGPGGAPGVGPGKGPGGAPGVGPGRGPGGAPGVGPGGAPGFGPGGAPGVGPGKGPGGAPGVGPGGAPGFGPGGAPGVGPGKGPGGAPGVGPGGAPGFGPGGAPGVGPGKGPGGAPGVGPGGAPGIGPGGAPGIGPGGAPGVGPGGAPGIGPGGAPGFGPGTAPGFGPGGAPGVGPSGAPGVGPGTAPSSPGTGPGTQPGAK